MDEDLYVIEILNNERVRLTDVETGEIHEWHSQFALMHAVGKYAELAQQDAEERY